jgi:hypothetical protein
MHDHKYLIHEIEDMIPWEREVYIQMLISHIKKEKEQARNRKPL